MIAGTVWAPKGPSPILNGSRRDNGLVTAIAVHPNDSNIVYIGTAGGGVWRTGNGGISWLPLFDRQISLSIGEPMSIAIDPNDADILYVGTSGRGRVSPQRQAGLFKSIDGGASWIRLGSDYPAGNIGNALGFANALINVIIVDPADSRTIYLASSTGVWRSTDAGQNWTVGTSSAGDARSLTLDRSSAPASRILYAGISGTGVIRSVDGGRTWTQILSAATPAVGAALAVVAGTTMNQVVVDLAPPTSPPAPGGIQVIYVAIAGGHPTLAPGLFPDPVGLFISTDQGASWTQRAATGGPGTSYSGYTLTIAVDPASPGDGNFDILYYGTSSQVRSTDAGASFSNLDPTLLHADTHSWAFFRPPAPAPTIVYCGTDGGISRSINNGANWTPPPSLNDGGLQTTLFYNIDIQPGPTGSVTVGALQDNGHVRSTGAPGWNTVGGGDGWDIVYDGITANQLVATTNSNASPQTRILRSTDDGTNWSDVTPWPSTGPEAGFFLASLAADPSAPGIFYAASNQNLWQSRDGGSTWSSLWSIPANFITAKVSVAPSNGNNVVLANGSQVLVSTNALAVSGVTFTNITLNLPGRSVLRAVFDPNDSTVIYVVLGGFAGAGAAGHVFRTTLGATGWTNISPALDVPFGAIALDGTDTPTTIYVGTDFGVLRSVDRGASWYVLDDIHFPYSSITDLVIGRGSGILRAATYGRGVFEFVRPQGPSIAVNPENDLMFGTICQGPQFLSLEIFNGGKRDLVISSVQRLMGSTSFSVLATPGTPLVIAAGGHVNFTVKYDPSVAGTPEMATIRIVSNDPNAPVVDLLATGLRGTSKMTTAIPDNGDFGNVCVRSFVDRELTINNSGLCPLRVQSISSSSAQFVVPMVVSYPLVISAGDSIALPIRFQPTIFGTNTANITLISNDPASPRIIAVSGTAPAPELDLIIADSGNFGNVCIDSILDKPLTLLNSGLCMLTVTNVTSSAAEFVVPNVLAYPIRIAPGTAVEVPIRFAPTGFGAKSGTITITSDDPTGAKSITVSGNVPSGKLAVTGSTNFGGVTACCCADRTISICNVGNCDLHVTSMRFKRNSHHWKLLHNPFPATLHGGSCLNVVIRYKATEKCSRCCELIIESDDPSMPVKTLEVLAYTIWDPCGCTDCCEDCRKGCCDKCHQESCCRQGYPCCDEDDEDHHDD